MLKSLKKIVPFFIAVVLAFAVMGIIVELMDKSAFQAIKTILFTSFRTKNGMVQTLNKFVPLALLALAYTVPLAGGKFNIGGQGQLLVGAVAATAVGIMLSNAPLAILLPLVLLAGVIAGAIWGLIPAYLLYKYNIHEILTTVILNFVSLAILSYFATEIWPDIAAGHPMTIKVGEGAFLPMLVKNPPLHIGIILVIIIVVAIYFIIEKSAWGYDLVATGSNPRAASVFGIKTMRMFMASLVIGGALGGLSGAIEVAGVHHRLIEGMQSNFMQLGLIVGLISQGKTRSVPFIAMFIAILEVGASALQRTMALPVEMVSIIEALILIFVLLSNSGKIKFGRKNRG